MNVNEEMSRAAAGSAELSTVVVFGSFGLKGGVQMLRSDNSTPARCGNSNSPWRIPFSHAARINT